MTDFIGGTTVSLLIGYVKLKGTCAACKNAEKDSFIAKDELYWMKGKVGFLYSRKKILSKLCFFSAGPVHEKISLSVLSSETR
jgi:hypothetical protein